MATNTPNFNLKKYELTDQWALTDQNTNMDIIDTVVGDPDTLTTTEKGSLVGAVNEVDANINLVQSGDEQDFVPSLNLFTGTYGTRIGKYIKKGNEVTVFIRIPVTTASFSSVSQLVIADLPFSINPDFPVVANIYISPKNTATPIPVATSLTTGTYDRLYVYRQESNTGGTFSTSEVVNGSVIQLSATYRIA